MAREAATCRPLRQPLRGTIARGGDGDGTAHAVGDEPRHAAARSTGPAHRRTPLVGLDRTVTVHKRADADTLVLRGEQHPVPGDELPAVGKGATTIRSGYRSPAEYEAVRLAA